MPQHNRELWRVSDFGEVKGLIDNNLKFFCDKVSPAGHSQIWHIGKKSSFVQHLKLEKINIVPIGFDALSQRRKDLLLQRIPKKKPRFPDVEFQASFLNCELVFANAGTDTKIKNDFLGKGGGGALDTFIDRASDYDFGIIQKEKDLLVCLRSKQGFKSESISSDREKFQALLMGIGFTHGFQPWPYRTEYWRGGRKISDEIKPRRILPRTSYAPFDRDIGIFSGRVKRNKKNSPTRLAARFFAIDDTFHQYINQLLFLFRETGGASFHIRTMALCSLFEGIISLVFEELKLADKLRASSSYYAEYACLRSRLARRIKRLAGKSGRQTLSRIANMLSSAQEFRVEDKFKAICQHFQLEYESEMVRHLDAWKRKRNPLMHGKWKETDEDFSDQALIAGAINIVALKVMGYSGSMKFNAVAYEIKDRYRII
jgi:hypothetical protein